ncbi:hypothetical protein J6590_103713, partial [Homalodisca vitripennis]
VQGKSRPIVEAVAKIFVKFEFWVRKAKVKFSTTKTIMLVGISTVEEYHISRENQR